jgi:cytochrome c peroxidase
VPRWFPVPKIPVDNPITEAKVELGRWLFYDERLSGNGTYSCGSCHQQALAFTDGLAHAIGSTGQHHSRSTMSLANVVYNASFGWDARNWSLEAQMEVPMYNEHPIEMGLKGREIEVLARFTKRSRDLERFRAAFPSDESPISVANIIKAIASFERVLVSADSPFDRYLYSDDRTDMTASARRGVALFFSDRLRCSECHGSVNMSGPTIFAGAMPSDPEAFFHDSGVAAKPAKFRAPTLRNIAVTAPYMHDGSLGTLKDVVQHYARGGRPRPEKSDRVRGFAISPEETEDLVAFLRSLTDERFLTNPAFSNPHLESSLRGQK